MPPWVVRLAMAIPLRRSLPAVLAYHRQIYCKYAQLRPYREHRVTRLLFVASSLSLSFSLALSRSRFTQYISLSLFSNHLPLIIYPFLPTSTIKFLFLRRVSFRNGIKSMMMMMMMIMMMMMMMITMVLGDIFDLSGNEP